MRSTLVLAFFCFAVAVTANAQKSLSLNLIQGNEYRQNSEMKMMMNQSVAGQSIDVVMTVKSKVVYKVTSVTAAGYDMDVQYQQMAMEIQMPQGGSMKFNSENPAEGDVMSQVLAGMISKSFQAQVSKTGRITDVKNIDVLFTAAFEKFPSLSDAQKEQIKNQLSQSYGKEAFASNMEMMLAIFPEKPVKVGENWTVQTKMKGGMPGNIESTYKYVEDGADAQVIHGDSKITAVDNGEYTVTNGMEMKFTMNGTMTSDIKIDKKTGWIKEAKISQSISGNANVKGNAQLPDGMTIPMSIKTDIVTTN